MWPYMGSMGLVDGPVVGGYRETPEQLRFWADRGVLAVEMQSASLFAFAHARGAQVAMVALVSNSVDEAVGHFDTGGHQFRVDVITAVARAAQALISQTPGRSGITPPAIPGSGTSA